MWATHDVTGITEVPRRLVVLGGGAAGTELAQAVHRLGADVTIVEAADHLLGREPAALGEALAESLRQDGIEVSVGAQATAVRHEDNDFIVDIEGRPEVRGERLLVATGRRPRVDGCGLETVGIDPVARGIPVDEHHRAGEHLWAIGDVTGIWPLTYMGEYQGEIVAANILGEPRVAPLRGRAAGGVHRPAGRSRRRHRGSVQRHHPLSGVAQMQTYTHAYAESKGFLTLLSDGDQLTGAYALGPEAGEWLQQATLAIRAQVPLDVLRDTIQPFPSFSETYAFTLKALHGQITASARRRSLRAGDSLVSSVLGRRRSEDAGPTQNRRRATCSCARRCPWTR